MTVLCPPERNNWAESILLVDLDRFECKPQVEASFKA